ncbi:hypothetical protein TthTF19_23880 (plasmid) [Thermus thermophilus]
MGKGTVAQRVKSQSGENHVPQDVLFWKQAGYLEGPRKSHLGQAVRRKARDPLSEKQDLSPIRTVLAPGYAKECTFACAVGPYHGTAFSERDL